MSDSFGAGAMNAECCTNKDSGKGLIRKIKKKEMEQKARLDLQHPQRGGYSQKKISVLTAFAFFYLIPLCLVHLCFIKKYHNYFLNIVENDLTRYLVAHLDGVCELKRFNQVKGKYFLLPLRVYSHTLRSDWAYSSGIMKWLVEKGCELYIVVFVKAMEEKTFFIREDYHAEASCIASIALVRSDIVTVCLQHGSMDLSAIMRSGVYPGQRAKIQIAHDKYTEKTFIENNFFDSVILKSVPCYSPSRVDYTELREIVFIGNNAESTRALAFSVIDAMADEIREMNVCVSYKPHPQEKIVAYGDLLVKSNMDDYRLIADGQPRVFIGTTSTVLYDAFMAGYKVIVLENQSSRTLDSLLNLGEMPVLQPEMPLLPVLKEYLKVPNENYIEAGALGYRSLVEKINELVVLIKGGDA